ncbi:MAG: hypothetical protein J6N93_03205 [Clostridia bacterium]|nr:hypothetical protein [Clostridia bacterium]
MTGLLSSGSWRSMSRAKRIAYFSIFTAITIVMQFVPITFGPVNINMTLIPLVLCGMVLGFWYSLSLGAIIGIVFLIQGITGYEPFTGYLFYHSPIILTITCVGKTAIAGGVGALIYQLLKDKNKYLATFLSAGIIPVVNTGIFVLGMLIIKGSLYEFLESAGLEVAGMNPLYVILVIVVTWNFFVEFGLNLLFAPAIYRIIKAVDKGF